MKIRSQSGWICMHAFVWSSVSCLVACQALIWALPETDGAYGISLFEFLSLPVVWAILLLFAGPMFLIGWYVADKKLRDVRLGWAIPRIAVAMIVTAMITGYWLHMASMVFVLMTGLTVIHWCANQAQRSPRLRLSYDPESDGRNRPPREADQPI